MVLEVPESQADAVESAINAHLPKVGSFHTRTYKKEGE